MNILALYLKEEVERKVNGRKKNILRMPATDVQICKALRSLGHDVQQKAYNKQFKLDKKYDLIFNLCDGLEDDTDFIEFKVLEDIERTDIPFTGNCLKTIKLCNDKMNIKKMLVKHNVLTPKFQVFKSQRDKLRKDMNFPLIVKPVCADAAVGIYTDSVVNNNMQLRQKVQRVIKKHNQPAALVEEYIDGRDLTIPVIGKKRITVLGPVELHYMRSYKRRPKILSYRAKWDKKKPIYKDYNALVRNPEKRFTQEELTAIKSTAEKVYRIMGCTGYATVDARLKNGRLFVIEINPNCWIGKSSETAHVLKKNYGVDYPGFIDRIVKIALEK